MKISRRGFLKGAGASMAGGLLLSRPEALAHPMISPQDKKAIEHHPSRMVAQLDPITQIEHGPEYVLWEGRLYYVTDWQKTLRMDIDKVISWEDPDGQLIVHAVPNEELRLGAVLIRGVE